MKKFFWRQNAFAIGAGIAYGLTARVIMSFTTLSSLWGGVFKTLVYTFIFLAPLVVGGLRVVLAPPECQRNWPYRIFMPMASCTLMMLAMMLAGLFVTGEAMIFCVFFAGPIVLVLGSIGGCLAGLIVTRWGSGSKT